MDTINKINEKLKPRKTNLKTEVYAGFTTFITMAYILAVNPNILSATGMDAGALFTATALSAGFATLFMGIVADYPFALAPAMGINAYFAFTVSSVYGWELALLAVFFEGIIFIILSFFNVREAIFDNIPKSLREGMTIGIGLFIAFIGLQNAGLIVDDSATLVAANHLTITSLITILGVLFTIVLIIRKVNGAILWGMLVAYGIGIVCQLVGLYVPNPEVGMYSLIPTAIISMPPSLAGNTIFDAYSTVAVNGVPWFDLIIVIMTLLFVDMFDTVATLLAAANQGKLLDENGKLPRAKQALLADAVGTTFGAVVGTSTVTTFAETSAGIAVGGKTGFTAIVTGILFLLALFFSPIFLAIPSFVTSIALIVVGFFMLINIKHIDFDDFTESVPAYLSMIMMPLTYSITSGILFGFLSYVLLKLFTGRTKEVSKVMWVIACIFVFKILFL